MVSKDYIIQGFMYLDNLVIDKLSVDKNHKNISLKNNRSSILR